MAMDINDVRTVITVLSFGAFVGIVWWAYSSRRKTSYDEAARMPLDDDDKPVHATGMAPHARESGSLPPMKSPEAVTGGSARPCPTGISSGQGGPADGGPSKEKTKH